MELEGVKTSKIPQTILLSLQRDKAESAAANSPQSFPTLCDPVGRNPPGSSV